MTTNNDALDALDNIRQVICLLPKQIQKAKFEEYEKIRNALQTQAELVADNQKLRKELDVVVRENAKYEERHKAWERQVYLSNPNHMFMAVGATEYNDDSGSIPVGKITDLLDKQAELVEALKEARKIIHEHRIFTIGQRFETDKEQSELISKIDKALYNAEKESGE